MTKARDLANSTAARDTNLSGFTNTFNLPTTDGTSGQYLGTDGAGNLSLSSIPSGGAQAFVTQFTGGDAPPGSLIASGSIALI